VQTPTGSELVDTYVVYVLLIFAFSALNIRGKYLINLNQACKNSRDTSEPHLDPRIFISCLIKMVSCIWRGAGGRRKNEE